MDILLPELIEHIANLCDLKTANSFFLTSKMFFLMMEKYIKTPEKIAESCLDYLGRFRFFQGRLIVFCYLSKDIDVVESHDAAKIIAENIGGNFSTFSDRKETLIDAHQLWEEQWLGAKDRFHLVINRKKNSANHDPGKLFIYALEKEYVPKRVPGGVFIVYF